jgi:hypothetical protein
VDLMERWSESFEQCARQKKGVRDAVSVCLVVRLRVGAWTLIVKTSC